MAARALMSLVALGCLTAGSALQAPPAGEQGMVAKLPAGVGRLQADDMRELPSWNATLAEYKEAKEAKETKEVKELIEADEAKVAKEAKEAKEAKVAKEAGGEKDAQSTKHWGAKEWAAHAKMEKEKAELAEDERSGIITRAVRREVRSRSGMITDKVNSMIKRINEAVSGVKSGLHGASTSAAKSFTKEFAKKIEEQLTP
mmetsp:Transcript_45281/g.129286  ORF Transcript_45281/g.129286 Transcript_45281/m.129286 type:complete len:201 (+) Transcript_45281:62-664(+)